MVARSGCPLPYILIEEPPEQAKRVLGKALAESVFIPNTEGITLNEDDEYVSKGLKDVGMVVQMPHIQFV